MVRISKLRHIALPTACGLGLSLIVCCNAWATAKQDVNANNRAVEKIAQCHYEEAVQILLPVLHRSPSYELARLNLAVAYDNLGLEQKDKPDLLLRNLWRSLCVDRYNKTTRQNLQTAIDLLNKDPKLAETHVALAHDCLDKNILFGAYIELVEAAAIKRDAATLAEIDALSERIQKSQYADADTWLAKMAVLSTDNYAALEDKAEKAETVHYEKYMAALEFRIKSHWQLPSAAMKPQQSKRAVVFFKVKKTGAISDLKIKESSGDTAIDDTCLAAVRAAGSPPLPAGSPEPMPVNFHFTLDAEDNKTAARAQLEDQVAASKSALSEASVLKASSASKQELIEKLMETATLEQRLGDFKNAGNDFAKAAHLAEARPVQKNLLLALYGEGECRKLSGDYGAAQQALTRALDVAVNGLNMPDREIVDLLDLYAKVLYKESKHDEARKIEARIEEAKNLGTKF